MIFWKIPSSKVFQLLFILKSLLLINLSFAKVKYQYDACDPRWANESLWLNFILRTNGTICRDEEIITHKYPVGFVSLIATAFANKNYSCGEFQICDPGILNRDLIRCYYQINNPENKILNKTLFQCIGLKFFNQTLNYFELEDEVLTGFTLIAAHVFPNETETNNRFLIEDVYERYVRGVDYRGKKVMYPWAEIRGIEKFKILNVHKEKKKRIKKESADKSEDQQKSETQEKNYQINKEIINGIEDNNIIKQQNHENTSSINEKSVNDDLERQTSDL